MFTKSGNCKSRLSRQGGLSLIELVVFIVIVSVSIAGIFLVLNRATQTSADPVARKQALAIAESLLEEIELMPFTLCDPDDAGAPPAFDAPSQGTTGSTDVSSLTVSHTVGAGGANRILVVGVNIFSSVDPFPTVSSMTYAGQTMIFLAAQNDDVAPNTRIRSEMWYITAPATGANNIVITFSAILRAVAGGMSYTNVNQTTPFGTAATATANSMTPSVAVSSAAGELVVDTVGIRENPAVNQTLTVGAGQTQRYNLRSWTSGTNNNVVGAGSEEAGAASVTMSWTPFDARPWAIVAAPLKPAGGCATPEAIGPEAGESRYFAPQFDNVNDYHGFTMNSGNGGIKDITNTVFPALNPYSASVSVVQEALGSIAATESLRVTVTVTGPGNTTVTLDGYRTRYAPDATQ